jgi:hypothetical protein
MDTARYAAHCAGGRSAAMLTSDTGTVMIFGAEKQQMSLVREKNKILNIYTWTAWKPFHTLSIISKKQLIAKTFYVA